MTQVPELYDLASRQNIAVLRYPMKENGSMSLMEPDGTCYIGVDDRVLDGGTQERMHLGHELGHCMTGSFTEPFMRKAVCLYVHGNLAADLYF